MASSAGPTADKILRRLIAAVERDPRRDVNVTLYLPWGYVGGYIVPSPRFAEDVRSHLTENGEADFARDLDDLESELSQSVEKAPYVYLGKGPRVRTGESRTAVQHVMRVRLADVSAWHIGE